MSKNKIAESIIIRVGGGIREVSRESAEVAEGLESGHQKPLVDQAEDVHSVGKDLSVNAKKEFDKIIN